MQAAQPPAPPVEASVVAVSPSHESAMFVTATLMFRNLTAQPVLVAHYKLSWHGGSFTGPQKPLRLEPYEGRSWNIRLTHTSGDIDALLREGTAAHVGELRFR